MIVKRNRAYVTSKGLVPIDSVCDLVSTGKNMDFVLKSFPMLNHNDVFECVDFYAQNTMVSENPDTSKLLALTNTDPEEIVIEVVNINQTVFLKLIEISRRFYPEETDFVKSMNNGLRICCLQNIERIENGEENMQDRLHNTVYHALLHAAPQVYDDLEKTKEDLDFAEFNKRRTEKNK